MLLFIANCAECGAGHGQYATPEIDISWELINVSQERFQLTGRLHNRSSHSLFDIELLVRTFDSAENMSGSSRFRFTPPQMNSEVVLPFGMMIDVADTGRVTRVDFDLYYHLLFHDDLLPQFIHFTDILKEPDAPKLKDVPE
ncbi:hypothetical protein OR1_03551 [Geobacter sp. OR-1]|nr:hypothetical protein OR1_03551 [Geobacter sp. OR-1]